MSWHCFMVYMFSLNTRFLFKVLPSAHFAVSLNLKAPVLFFLFFLFQLINTLPGVDGWLGWKGRQNKGYLVEYQFLIDFNIVLCCYPDIFLIF